MITYAITFYYSYVCIIMFVKPLERNEVGVALYEDNPM